MGVGGGVGDGVVEGVETGVEWFDKGVECKGCCEGKNGIVIG